MKQLPLSQKARIILGSTIAGIVVLLIFGAIALNALFAPKRPELTISFPETFSDEETLTLTGEVHADCNCELTVIHQAKQIDVDQDGKFSIHITPPKDENSMNVSVIARATGAFWNTSSLTTTESAYSSRNKLPLTFENAAKSNGKPTYTVSLNTAPQSTITVIGYFTQDVPNPNQSAAMEEIVTESDEEGNVLLELPFDNAFMTTQAKYKIVVSKSNYKPAEEEIFVKNEKYNPELVAAEKEKIKLAEEEAKRVEAEQIEANRIQGLIDSMNYYDGSGAIEIAIGNNGFKKSRSIGYYSVNNPAEYQYVQIPVLVRNTGLSEEHVNPLYFTIMDENGRTYNFEDVTYSMGGGFSSINLQPGGKTDGWFAFILPKAQTEFTMIYSDGFGNKASKKMIIQ